MAKQIKNQTRKKSEDMSSHEIEDHIDKNSDDLKFKVIQETEGRRDWDFKNLEFAHTQLGDQLLDHADHLIKYFSENLGPDTSKPKVPGIFKMYREALRSPEAKSYLPVLERIEQHSPGSNDDLLKAKYTFEQSSHKENTNYLLNGIKGGAGIETAKVNWSYSVQSYKEAKENAELTFKESIYLARADGKSNWEKKYSSIANEILAHQNHFNYATQVANATDAYGKLMASANTALATAFSALMTELVKNWNLIAQGEATLIVANKKDSLTLWTSIKNSYDKKLGGSR